MGLTSILSVAFVVHLLAGPSSAAVIRRSTTIATPSFTVTDIGLANDPKTPRTRRDGGGGNVLGNKNWIVFSDTELVDPFQWGGSNSFTQVSY